MGKRLVVVMTRGGQGRVVIDTCIAAGYEVTGILDDSPDTPPQHNGVPVLGRPGDWRSMADGTGFALALGQRERIELGSKMLAAGRALPAIVHPSAVISPSAALSAGSIVMSNCTVNANASLGQFVIVNANCSVDHDCVLELASQLGPGVIFPGSVHVGEGAFVGAGAVCLPRKRIGAWAVVGAGAVVTRDIPDGATAAGNPARVIAVP